MTYEELEAKRNTKKCLLCRDAACGHACPSGVSPDRILRSLFFGNDRGAAAQFFENPACFSCSGAPCMKSCVLSKAGSAPDVRAIFNTFFKDKADDLSTEQPALVSTAVDFLGVRCENPFFLSSSIVGSNEEMISKAFDMGWAGVALKTVGTFVPEETSPRFDATEKNGGSPFGFKNIEQISDHTLEENLAFIRNLKARHPSKVIIASIMGQNEEEWTYLAKVTEHAGADMIECNFSCPHMSREGLGSDVGSDPETVRRYTEAVRRGTHLPVLAKMTPNITHMELPAIAAIKAGADGIAAINTIKSIMNVDLDTFCSGPDVSGKSSVGGYSGKAVKPIALRFIHDMKKNETLKDCPVSGMGGIETWQDAAEFIALGCETVQVTTAVMLYGYRIIEDLNDGLSRYLAAGGFSSVSELVGKALPNLLPADDLDRGTILYPGFDRSLCVACGRCVLSCSDGGHQAIRPGPDGRPILDPKKCAGCHLCRLVCPTGAVTPGKRVTIRKGK